MGNALWNMAYVHLQAENATLKTKVESLEAAANGWVERTQEAEALAQEWEKSYLRAKIDLAGARAKLRALEGAARELVAFGHPMEGSAKYHAAWEALEKALAAHPTKEEEANQGMRRAAPRDGGAA